MKKKLSIIFCIMLLVVFALPTTAFAGIIPTYDTAETAQLKAFLNLDSAEAGKTNGQQINASYDENDPATWSGITWTTTTPYKAQSINWNDSNLKGALNISNFTALQGVSFSNNEISSLDVSGDTVLEALFIESNTLSALDLSDLTALEIVACDNNQISQLTLTNCTSLNNLWAMNNKISAIDLSTCTHLDYLYLGTNELTSLNLNGSIAIKELDCSFNDLTSLDVHDQTGLNELYCNNNKLTALNVADLDSLEALICNDNKLSGHFDAAALTGLRYFTYYNNSISSLALGEEWFNILIGYNNPTTSITTNMFTYGGDIQTFSTDGDGYISFNMNTDDAIIFLYAQPKENNVFVNYTTNGSELSASPIHYFDPSEDISDDVVANFSAGLSSSDEDSIIYEGGRITLSPYYSGGTWGYNENYFSAAFTDPNSPVFKGLKKGTTTITYTMPANTYTYEEPILLLRNTDEPNVTTEDKGVSYVIPALPDQNLTISMALTINETVLPQTGQDFTIVIMFMTIGLAGITGILFTAKKKKKNV